MKGFLLFGAFVAVLAFVHRPAPVPRGWFQAFYDEAVIG